MNGVLCDIACDGSESHLSKLNVSNLIQISHRNTKFEFILGIWAKQSREKKEQQSIQLSLQMFDMLY